MPSLQRLEALSARAERLLEQLARRQILLAAMRALGEEIDAAWQKAAQESPSPERHAELLAWQQRQQQRIEKLRSEADEILAACRHVHADVARCLLDLARAFPGVLPLADQARLLALVRRHDSATLERYLIAARQRLEEAERVCSVPAETPCAATVPAPEPQSELLTAHEVARKLRVSAKTVYRLAAQGRLPARRIGRSVRFRREDIEVLPRSDDCLS